VIAEDPDDSRNVIVEIRAGGTGGDEAALLRRPLAMYTRYAEKKGWKSEVMDVRYRDSRHQEVSFLLMATMSTGQ